MNCTRTRIRAAQAAWRWAAAAAFTVVLVAAPARPAASDSDSDGNTRDAFHWTGRVAPGKTLEIKGVNGSIRAQLASGDRIRVDAVKHARKSRIEDVTVEVIEHEGGVTLCAHYPAPFGEPENECKPGNGGRNHTRNNDVVVDFTVEVPANVAFAPRTVNGEIEAEGLKGDVDATTVNGSVAVSTSGLAAATTVNGSIRATMGSVRWEDDLDFSTVNGGITLDLPARIKANLRAETVNGDIETDFPITMNGRFSRHKLRGTIGGGGAGLSLTTVNGDIRLHSLGKL